MENRCKIINFYLTHFHHFPSLRRLQEVSIKLYNKNNTMGSSISKVRKILTPLQLEQYKIIQLTQKLNSNSFVKVQQINKVKLILLSGAAEMNKINYKGESAKPSQFFPLIADKNILLKWKVLAFCGCEDIYQQNMYGRHEKYEHHYYDQIQKDINRTYLVYLDEQNKDKLNRVLLNICLYFPQIGYTQGMNYLIGFFILCGFTEEQTFWIFCHLAVNPNYLIIGLFQDQFPVVKLYSKIFHKKLRQINFKVDDKLFHLQIADEGWLFKWIFSYYLYIFDFQKCIKIWDHILKTNGLSIISIALAILETLFVEILAAQCDFQFYQIFKSDKLNKKIVIQQIITRAEAIQIDYNYLDQSQFCGSALSYLKIFKNADGAYTEYTESIKSKRQLFINQQAVLVK